MKPLVVIPARGGSKGIPYKNIKPLGGNPLIQHTIEAARAVFPDSIICVSTDDLKIKEVVESLGLKVPFIRPAELATDTAGTREVLLHAVDFFESKNYLADTIVLLQPTSPLRTANQIEEAIALFDDKCDMVVSVKEASSNPYYNLFEENEKGYLLKSKQGNFTRRQDCPKVWELNGAIYIIRVESIKQQQISGFENILKYVMDDYTSLDIDRELDFIIGESIIKYKK